jgi:hypothetical protein
VMLSKLLDRRRSSSVIRVDRPASFRRRRWSCRCSCCRGGGGGDGADDEVGVAFVAITTCAADGCIRSDTFGLIAAPLLGDLGILLTRGITLGVEVLLVKSPASVMLRLMLCDGDG